MDDRYTVLEIMTGGLIELAAHGKDDLFLTNEPQITFFKVIYRRHTNFSTEETEHSFLSDVNFGAKYVCLIPHDGDLIDGMSVRITLPEIPQFATGRGLDTITQIAWARYIGFVLIRSIEIEVNGRVIDRHYGEWMYIWSCLTTTNLNDGGLDRLIGNIPELYEFTTSKPSYTLYIPLYFWFCRNTGCAIPVVALQYSDIRVNLEIDDLDNCILISPTHYIQCDDEMECFKPGEYLVQNQPDGTRSYGRFHKYDIQNKRLYYQNIGATRFIGNRSDTKNTKSTDYLIYGTTSKFYVSPALNIGSIPHIFRKIRLQTLARKDTVLLVNFVYLDEEERYKFAQTKHDYLIERLYYTPSVQIDSSNTKIKLNIDQPCKLIVWVPRLRYIAESNDWTNYTDNHQRDPATGNPIGAPLILKERIMLNSGDRTTDSNHQYYEYIQSYTYSDNSLPHGVGMYSFALFPLNVQPSGTTNMSQIELIELAMRMNRSVSQNNVALIRVYALCYNILRINNGLCATVFTR